MRKFSGSPPEKDIEGVTKKDRPEIITQERKYQVITPLYGGGVSSSETDPITPIRGSEIRGHLRFWWRAYYGRQYGDPALMKQAEDALWGAAAKKEEKDEIQSTKEKPQSTVQIEVETHKLQANTQQAPFFLNQDGKVKPRENIAPAYAAFPLQPSDKDPDAGTSFKTVGIGISFTLKLSFPAAQQQAVETALWAWETFGGIGARTRRGFGALRLLFINGRNNTDLPDANIQQSDINKQTPEDWIKQRLEKIVVSGTYPVGMPYLSPTTLFKFTPPSATAKAVWDHLIRKLKAFRQRRQPSTGRSEWPEPSEIRRFAEQSLPGHDIPPIPDPAVDKFPRAVFGLPIIFQFKDREKQGNPDNKKKDPRNTILQLDRSERLASPLILKPLACSGGKYVGLALLLEGTELDEDKLILKTQTGTKKEKHVKASFETTDAPLVVGEDHEGNPISIDSNTNALQAFFRYL